MNKVSLQGVPIEHRVSPQGRYELYRQHVSVALGGQRDVGPWGGGHPFDVEFVRLPAGKSNYPLHSHAAQTEFYIILSGTGLLYREPELEPMRLVSGDHVICHPQECHQILNDGLDDLVYYVIADQHRAEVTSYPKTGKRQIKPEYRCVGLTDVAYYDEEE